MPQENQTPGTGDDQNRQSAREGGYGDDTGLAQPQARPEQQAAGEGEHGDSGAGRENPAASAIDADDALGNRAGGYGRSPESDTNASNTGLPDA